MKDRDISKQTVVMLLSLTVIISLLSTWSVTNAAGNIKIPQQEDITINKESGNMMATSETATINEPPIGEVSITFALGDEQKWILYQIKD